MDQATPAHQTVLRHVGERREESGMDSSQHVRTGGVARKRMNVDLSLHSMLQVLSVTLLRKSFYYSCFPTPTRIQIGRTTITS